MLNFYQYYHMTFQSIFKNGDVWVIKFVVGTWLVHDEIFHEYNEIISTSTGCNHIEPIFLPCTSYPFEILNLKWWGFFLN